MCAIKTKSPRFDLEIARISKALPDIARRTPVSFSDMKLRAAVPALLLLFFAGRLRGKLALNGADPRLIASAAKRTFRFGGPPTKTSPGSCLFPLPGADPLLSFGAIRRIFMSVASKEEIFISGASIAKRRKSNGRKLLGDGDHKERKQNMSSPSPVTDGKNVWVLDRYRCSERFRFPSANEMCGAAKFQK